MIDAWVLVLIVLTGTEPTALEEGIYLSMFECFAAREAIMEPTNASVDQAVCIRIPLVSS